MSNVNKSRINSSHQKVEVGHSGGNNTPQLHTNTPGCTTPPNCVCSSSNGGLLGTLSDRLGQGEASSRKLIKSFDFPQKPSDCPPRPERVVTSRPVIQPSKPESSRDLNHRVGFEPWTRCAGFGATWPQRLAKTSPRCPGLDEAPSPGPCNVRVYSFCSLSPPAYSVHKPYEKHEEPEF